MARIRSCSKGKGTHCGHGAGLSRLASALILSSYSLAMALMHLSGPVCGAVRARARVSEHALRHRPLSHSSLGFGSFLPGRKERHAWERSEGVREVADSGHEGFQGGGRQLALVLSPSFIAGASTAMLSKA